MKISTPNPTSFLKMPRKIYRAGKRTKRKAPLQGPGRVRKKRRVALWNRKRFMMYRNPMTQSSVRTCLKYNQIIAPNPTAGNITTGSSYVFSMNSLYDPDTSGVGGQPMYYDQYGVFYNRYRVNYAQITVTVINHAVNTDTGTGAGNTLTTTPNYSYKLAIVADRDNPTLSEAPTNVNQLIEEGGPNIKWRFVAPSLNGKLPKLFHSGSPHRLTGLSFKEDVLQADFGANPSRQTFFWIAIVSADGVTDPPSVYLNVNIKYYCEFFDRRVNQLAN